MQFFPLYNPEGVLIDVFAGVDKAVAAAPSGAIVTVSPSPDQVHSGDWIVDRVTITETGRIKRDIERILGHKPGAYLPTSIKAL